MPWRKTNSIRLEKWTKRNNYSVMKKKSHFSHHWDSLDKTIRRIIEMEWSLHVGAVLEFWPFLRANDRHNCRSRRSDHPPLVCLNGRFAWFLKLTDRAMVGNRYFRLSWKSLSVSFQRAMSDSLEHVFLWCVPLEEDHRSLLPKQTLAVVYHDPRWITLVALDHITRGLLKRCWAK